MTNNIIGVVIRKIELNSDDEIITLLTPSEVISFIALGVRKIKSKNRYALDYGNIINAEIFKARLTNKLSKLKRSTIFKQPPIATSDTANVILIIMKNLWKVAETSSRLFNAINESYDYLGDTYNHHVKTFITFNILDSIGLYPSFDKCIECNRKDRISSFDFHQGGFLCAWHTKEDRAIEELKAIQNLNLGIKEYIQTDPKINKKIYYEIINLLNDYIFIEKNN